MHELSITQSILSIAPEKANEVQASKVTKINLIIGELSGVVDECVEFYFDLLSKDTIAAQASLSFERTPNKLRLGDIDLLLIENVGNLICPAEFAPGEHKKVMLSSLPEGDDKPYKYPLMFAEADVVLINKIDLLPYLEFNIPAFHKAVIGLNPTARILQVSCKTGEGLEDWFSWLLDEIKQIKSRYSQEN